MNIETALQNLSGTFVVHIEPNRNKTVEESILLMGQGDIETNLKLLKRPSPTFSELSRPRTLGQCQFLKKTMELINKETDNRSDNIAVFEDITQSITIL
ncbi:22655_t:CDS:2 [Gigaspora margarita]|uniref:22655_t:CDS:1 n=1 Tax=Gigaspora margarita TaxID=4874 RepID=A0ABN7UF54_GIGMA|nr:22655_t:CDS:2 [Gigaspora margarita]